MSRVPTGTARWSHNVSPPRVMLPRVLPSTGVTPLPRYYDPSDFLIVLLASSLCPLVRQYFPSGKNDEDLPRSPPLLWVHAMLSDPGGVLSSCP